MFVRFTGIDYDADDDAIAKLDDFVRRAQRVFVDCGGNLLQLTLGDKGAYLYAVFGSPHAHEDDAARAAAAGLYLLALEGVTGARDLQIGIAQGRLRSGTYGHDMRRTFVCLGDAVNLAARLMSRAPIGEIYVEETIREQAGEAFAWERLAEMTVKGKVEPISVYALRGLGADAGKRRRRYELPIVGRRVELATIENGLAAAREGQGTVIGVSAEAGIGKSRLLAEFVREARDRGVVVAFGECQAFGSKTSYGPWREIWRTLLRIDDALPESEQVLALEQELAVIDPALLPRAPLLDVLLGITIPDTELTRSFEPELRKTSLEALLADCLRARASEEPVVLVLEDCHWIDSLSRDLLETLARVTASIRALVLLTYRPNTIPAPGSASSDFRTSRRSRSPSSGPRTRSSSSALGSSRCSGKSAEVPATLIELVTDRSQGNAFYIEELLNYIQGQGVDLHDEAALGQLQLPESLHSLILSRIDTLTEEPRRTLKVASVMGRTFFAPALPAVYPELGSLDEVRDHLGALRSVDLVRLDREDDEAYIFKHVVTREVTYESMPFALRSLLHESAGDYLETVEADAIERNLDLLAHHYWHSRNDDKKRDYLVRAGDAAKARFANAAAIDYFERAGPLLDGTERWRVTRSLGEALETTGDIGRAEATYREAREIAEDEGDGSAAGWTETSLAELARKSGDYVETEEWLAAARTHFEQARDRLGQGRVLHIAGIVATVRGDFAAARADMEESLAIRREFDDKPSMGALYSNLAIAAEYEGDLERWRSLHEKGLALRIEAGDTAGIAVSRMNLGLALKAAGRLDEARAQMEESLQVRREIGDPRMIALGEHNLGLLTREEGDYGETQKLFADALRVQRDQGDKWALAYMLEDVAVLAVLKGEPGVALRFAGAGSALREEIRAPRGPAVQEELAAQLAPAREALGERADSVWNEGRSLGLDKAISQALSFCESD